MKYKVIVTCEHAGNKIPANLSYLNFSNKMLNSHRAFDFGSLELFNNIKKELKQKKIDFFSSFNLISRQVIDYNRSVFNKNLIIYERSISLSAQNKLILEHQKYTQNIIDYISSYINDYKIIHLGIHSFTPRLEGKKRDNVVSFLYDPESLLETIIVDKLDNQFENKFKTKKNYPYLGTDDGLTTFLRYYFQNDANYAGVEVEVNQRILKSNNQNSKKISKLIIDCLNNL